MQRAGSKAEPRGSCAGYGTQPSADRHPPPTTGGSGSPQIALYITATGQHRGKKTKRSKEFYISRASRVQAASGEAKMSSQYSRLNRETETLASLVLIPLRPPRSHRMWWLGESMLALSSCSWASPNAPAGHSYLLQRAACCPCCGGML